MGIKEEIRDSFKEGSVLTKLIYVNLGIFVLFNIIHLFFFLSATKIPFSIFEWFSVPTDVNLLIHRPWTIISYMFLHEGFLHILFNMLWLFWFGKIFLQFIDEKRLLSVYFLGGISGAIFYILSFNIFPVFQSIIPFSFALGASASIVAIVVAISFYVPNYELQLMFIGRVKLKYIAIVSIGIDVISIASSNAGGHLAHLGGAIFGYLFILQYKKKKNTSLGFANFLYSIGNIFKKKQMIKVTHKKPKTDWEYNAEKVKEQENLDHILDKISKSGYDSLTKEEKAKLFNMSNKN